MFPWGHAPTEVSGPNDGFRLGGAIYSGDTGGRIVSMDYANGTMGVVWSDGDGGEITYPLDADYLRSAFPWE